jgi:hypothetical protein
MWWCDIDSPSFPLLLSPLPPPSSRTSAEDLFDDIGEYQTDFTTGIFKFFNQA